MTGSTSAHSPPRRASPRFAAHDRATFDAVLDSCERLAEAHFAPHARRSDIEEPHIVDGCVRLPDAVAPALRAFADSGMAAATEDEALGGMQLPAVVEKAALAYLAAANVATVSYALLAMANARLLLAHGTPAQVEAFARPQLEGRWLGTMCLSETQAGSSLGDITTRAEPDDADAGVPSALGARYRLTGRKMWISGGEHDLAGNIVHLVLAKIPGDDGRLLDGARGVSLFVVPKCLPDADGAPGVRNDIALAGLNHKLGYRGTVNCVLHFGEGAHPVDGRAGAVGWLVGAPGRGLAAMFHMMNEARIGVGLGAVALGYTGYLHALDYARGRTQGRVDGDAATPQVPLVAHADVRRMLLAQKAYVEGGLGLVLYCARLVDEARIASDDAARADTTRLLDLLTPVAKSWPAQWCLAANDLAIQVHGGYGYARDYRVEQLWRDNRLNAIHEGTHGIQAIDLLGRKVAMDDGAAFAAWTARVAQDIAGARTAATGDAAVDTALAAHADALDARLQRLAEVTAALRQAADPRLALANASVYLEAFGHVAVAWIWLQQARVAGATPGDFHDGKRAAARYFFAWELPRIDPQLDLLASLERTPYDMRDGGF